MVLPTGQISMSEVNTELSLAATTTISLNQTNVRTLAGVASGAISMDNLRGKSNLVVLALSQNTAPGVAVYPWTSSGYGAKFTNPAAGGSALALSATKGAIAIGSRNPLAHAWPFSASGFGTKYTNPASLAVDTNVRGMNFNPSGSALAIGRDTTPFIMAFNWSSSGFGSQFSNPSVLPGGVPYEVKFHPNGNTLFVGTSAASNQASAYQWSSSGFGTRFTSPTVWGTNNRINRISFNPSGSVVGTLAVNAPILGANAWSDTTGWGTRYTNPTTMPGGIDGGLSWDPDGDAIVVSFYSSPYLRAYNWSDSTGFGTAISIPTVNPVNSNSYASSFLSDGSAIAIGSISTPFVRTYSWSASGFGTQFANPSTLPGSNVNDIYFGAI
jgi:hypothetical protein